MTATMNRVIQRYVHAHKDKINTNNVASSIAVIIAPFMTNILTKYDENDWHRVMRNRYVDEQGKLCFGMDWINDWRSNHPLAFNMMSYFARTMRQSLNFDPNVATDMVLEIIASWNWKVYPHERVAVRHTIYRIKRLIFA